MCPVESKWASHCETFERWFRSRRLAANQAVVVTGVGTRLSAVFDRLTTSGVCKVVRAVANLQSRPELPGACAEMQDMLFKNKKSFS
jgi:hypothetical protein